MILAQRTSEEKMDSDSDDDNDGIKYRMKILHLDSIMDLQESRQLKIKDGRSKSQKYRWVIEQKVGDYDGYMDWLIGNADKHTEEYLEHI